MTSGSQVRAAYMARYSNRARESGSFVRGPCPVHLGEDENFSLFPSGAGQCFSQCGRRYTPQEVSVALDLEWEQEPLTVNTLAEAFQLPAQLLQELGIEDRQRGDGVRIPYMDTTGQEITTRIRHSLYGARRFSWAKGSKPTIYGLPAVKRMQVGCPVLIVEGESDVWTLHHANVAALGIPGASMKQLIKQLPGLIPGRKIYVWQEPGDAGGAFARAVCSAVPEAKVIAPPEGVKDPVELWLREPDIEAFKCVIDDLMHKAVAAKQLLSKEMEETTRAAWSSGKTILEHREPLALMDVALHESGFVGDTSPVKLSVLACLSPLLRIERPLRMLLTGPSSAGKSARVKAALQFVPGDLVHRFDGASERALIYTEKEYSNRTVVLWEADSLPEEGPAATAFRTLADGEGMRYEVTVEAPEGGHTTREIFKPGPTALITTSTKPLGNQSMTRLLQVTIEADAAQVRAVFQSMAAAAEGRVRGVDATNWQSAITWLAAAGKKEVIIPYASQLASLMPGAADKHPRLQRDFEQLLTLIQVCAFLHQLNRQVDGEGRILAAVDDYRVAYDLLSSAFKISMEDGLTRPCRDAVVAVREIVREGQEYATNAVVAEHLGKGKSQVSESLNRASQLGYLKNLAPHRGSRNEWVPADPLPEDTALPNPEQLRVRVEPASGNGPETRKPGSPSSTSQFADEPSGIPVEIQEPDTPPEAPTWQETL